MEKEIERRQKIKTTMKKLFREGKLKPPYILGDEVVKIDKGKLYQLYVVDKFPIRKTADLLKVSRSLVNKRLHKYGWIRTESESMIGHKVSESQREKKRIPIDKNKLYQLYCVEGYSTPDLGKIFKAAPVTIQKRLRKYGWVIRSRKVSHNQPKYIDKLVRANLGKKATKETKKKLSEVHKGLNAGEKHPNWQGGKSFEPYGLEFNRKLKEIIRKRDGYRCQECFRHQDELFVNTKSGIRPRKLYIHHIDYNKRNNNPQNLVSLCLSCHLQTNWDREDWTRYYRGRMQL